MEYKDYYQTLGVAKNATAEDIKKAYRKLMRKHHPDVNKAKDASDKAKEINEAYAVLGDTDKRAAYDALGSGARAGQPFQPPPDWGATYDFGGGNDDFFSDLFAHVGRRSRHGSAFRMRGEDIHATIAIDLADAYHGATRTVSLRMPQAHAQGRAGSHERMLDVVLPPASNPKARELYQAMARDLAFNPRAGVRV